MQRVTSFRWNFCTIYQVLIIDEHMARSSATFLPLSALPEMRSKLPKHFYCAFHSVVSFYYKKLSGTIASHKIRLITIKAWVDCVDRITQHFAYSLRVQTASERANIARVSFYFPHFCFFFRFIRSTQFNWNKLAITSGRMLSFRVCVCVLLSIRSEKSGGHQVL